MKTFMYFENQEGGMGAFFVEDAIDLYPVIKGWMSGIHVQGDKMLRAWMEDAEVGDYAEHRLGVMVRVKDTE